MFLHTLLSRLLHPPIDPHSETNDSRNRQEMVSSWKPETLPVFPMDGGQFRDQFKHRADPPAPLPAWGLEGHLMAGGDIYCPTIVIVL